MVYIAKVGLGDRGCRDSAIGTEPELILTVMCRILEERLNPFESYLNVKLQT